MQLSRPSAGFCHHSQRPSQSFSTRRWIRLYACAPVMRAMRALRAAISDANRGLGLSAVDAATSSALCRRIRSAGRRNAGHSMRMCWRVRFFRKVTSALASDCESKRLMPTRTGSAALPPTTCSPCPASASANAPSSNHSLQVGAGGGGG